MGLFDKLKQAAEQAAGSVTAAASCKTAEVIFPKLPDTLEEFKALSQAQLSTPFDTAAMTVLALYFYPQNAELSLEMLGFLKGPQQLSGMINNSCATALRTRTMCRARILRERHLPSRTRSGSPKIRIPIRNMVTQSFS